MLLQRNPLRFEVQDLGAPLISKEHVVTPSSGLYYFPNSKEAHYDFREYIVPLEESFVIRGLGLRCSSNRKGARCNSKLGALLQPRKLRCDFRGVCCSSGRFPCDSRFGTLLLLRFQRPHCNLYLSATLIGDCSYNLCSYDEQLILPEESLQGRASCGALPQHQQ